MGTPAPSGPRLGFLELLTQGLDLVAELGRVLEAEVVSREQHLLLELHDRARDLFRLHAVPVAAPRAPAAPGDLGFERQEVRDVGDPLPDRLGRGRALLEIRRPDRPQPAGLADRTSHGRRALVDVVAPPPAHLPRRTADGL